MLTCELPRATSRRRRRETRARETPAKKPMLECIVVVCSSVDSSFFETGTNTKTSNLVHFCLPAHTLEKPPMSSENHFSPPKKKPRTDTDRSPLSSTTLSQKRKGESTTGAVPSTAQAKRVRKNNNDEESCDPSIEESISQASRWKLELEEIQRQYLECRLRNCITLDSLLMAGAELPKDGGTPHTPATPDTRPDDVY